MKNIIILSITLFQSCSTRPSRDDTVKLTKMWTDELNQTSVIDIYGTNFKQVEDGVTYQRSESSWPKFAFFFDKEKKVKNQFALLDGDELNILKKSLDCTWIEKQVKAATPHAVQAIPVGECEKYSIRYEFKKDWGLYEVKKPR